MSLTIKHLNTDASFLLTFSPIPSSLPTAAPSTSSSTKSTSSTSFSQTEKDRHPSHDFTILLDPWLTGASTIIHPKFSFSTHLTPPSITSLSQLPSPPKLVLVSQSKSDHCHEGTLKTLSPNDSNTLIMAEPSSAKDIRSWKYFDPPERVIALQRYEESKSSTIQRIILPALEEGGKEGEVTIAWIPQRVDITNLHSAIGITYRPPTTATSIDSDLDNFPFTPPASPLLPLTQEMPLSPVSPNSTFMFPILPPYKPSPPTTLPLSVLFAPHGLAPKTLMPYIRSHLYPLSALPLTVMLHCMDRIDNPWYLGGNICAGAPGGAEIAKMGGVRWWVGAHDGVKRTGGWGTGLLRRREWDVGEVGGLVSPRSGGGEKEKDGGVERRRGGTEVVVLGVGEEVTVGRGLLGGR